ncbi:hypothetical protein DL95DRAFT_471755 [Leptodontidium sp. 2 PMI_412]|nr:hypothetical protein DL95DRAFT_471755 [Leptodontidium sp. 2 PMI_412]
MAEEADGEHWMEDLHKSLLRGENGAGVYGLILEGRFFGLAWPLVSDLLVRAVEFAKCDGAIVVPKLGMGTYITTGALTQTDRFMQFYLQEEYLAERFKARYIVFDVKMISPQIRTRTSRRTNAVQWSLQWSFSALGHLALFPFGLLAGYAKSVNDRTVEFVLDWFDCENYMTQFQINYGDKDWPTSVINICTTYGNAKKELRLVTAVDDDVEEYTRCSRSLDEDVEGCTQVDELEAATSEVLLGDIEDSSDSNSDDQAIDNGEGAEPGAMSKGRKVDGALVY